MHHVSYSHTIVDYILQLTIKAVPTCLWFPVIFLIKILSLWRCFCPLKNELHVYSLMTLKSFLQILKVKWQHKSHSIRVRQTRKVYEWNLIFVVSKVLLPFRFGPESEGGWWTADGCREPPREEKIKSGSTVKGNLIRMYISYSCFPPPQTTIITPLI